MASRRHIIYSLLVVLLSSAAALGATAEPPSSRPETTIYEANFDDPELPIIIPVRWRDSDHYFAVDTGSTFTVLDDTWFQDLVPEGHTVTVNSGGASRIMPAFKAPKLMVGPLQLADFGVVLRENLANLRITYERRFVGILGTNALKDKVVQFDFDSGKVRIMLHDDASHPEWGNVVPLEFERGCPVVKAKFFNRDVSLMIDSGSIRYSGLSKDLFDQASARMSARTVADSRGTIWGFSDARLLRVPFFEIGGRKYQGVLFQENGSLDGTGALGTDFLSRNLVTLDFPGKKLYLKAGKRFNEPQEWCMSGMSIGRNAGDTYITQVDAGGPAEKSGIRKGDYLLEVDGRPTSEIPLPQLVRLFRSPEGRVIKLRYRRGTTETITSITLKRAI